MIQIVTVRSGDSVYSLASKYGSTPDEIVKDNGLNPAETLVVGQALIVNTKGIIIMFSLAIAYIESLKHITFLSLV